MANKWLMDSVIKTRIEDVVQELIDTRGATQERIKRFFASERVRKRMLDGYDDMIEREEHVPMLAYIEEAQTD